MSVSQSVKLTLGSCANILVLIVMQLVELAVVNVKVTHQAL